MDAPLVEPASNPPFEALLERAAHPVRDAEGHLLSERAIVSVGGTLALAVTEYALQSEERLSETIARLREGHSAFSIPSQSLRQLRAMATLPPTRGRFRVPAVTVPLPGAKFLIGALASLNIACAADASTAASSDVSAALEAPSSSLELRVSMASKGDDALIGSREHLALDRASLEALSLQVGQQVVVARGPDAFAVFTVVRAADTDARGVAMGKEARNRIGILPGDIVRISAFYPESERTDEDVEDNGGFVERTSGNGSAATTLILAPHGGMIERYTDAQAEATRNMLGDAAVAWTCKGYRPGGGASERWHVTSEDISHASFPLLAKISDKKFELAVSFHGYEGDTVLIGGAAGSSLKERLRAAIERELKGSGIVVRVATADDRYDGDSPQNIVNRLAKNGGVQIEQPMAARSKYGTRIAAAVARTLRTGAPD